MRTTVEITSAQRARLLELAARRGDKGFSRLVQEALDAYLEAVAGEEAKRRKALQLRGTLPEAEAEALREATREIRGTWR
jgi:hypothetical protein